MKTNHYKKFNPIRDEVGKPALSNNLQETTYRRDAWKTENTLTYDKTFGEHTVVPCSRLRQIILKRVDWK